MQIFDASAPWGIRGARQFYGSRFGPPFSPHEEVGEGPRRGTFATPFCPRVQARPTASLRSRGPSGRIMIMPNVFPAHWAGLRDSGLSGLRPHRRRRAVPQSGPTVGGGELSETMQLPQGARFLPPEARSRTLGPSERKHDRTTVPPTSLLEPTKRVSFHCESLALRAGCDHGQSRFSYKHES